MLTAISLAVAIVFFLKRRENKCNYSLSLR
nr:MAG TPA: Mid2 like cell wall stress sensor [Caudoviricetes sp.]